MFDSGGKTLARIQRISRIIRALCALVIVFLVLIGGITIVSPAMEMELLLEYSYERGSPPGFLFDFRAPTEGTSGWVMLAELASLLLCLSLVIFAFDRLRRLFGLYAQGVIFYAQGVIFSAANSRHLRTFALSVIGLAILIPLSEPLVGFVSLWSATAEKVTVRFSFGLPELGMIFISMVFLAIARVMELGNALAEEQAQIV